MNDLCNVTTPCALLGAVQSLASIRNCVCIIHGTTGCGFFCRNYVIRKAGYFLEHKDSFTPKVFCTELGEMEIVLGGEQKLRQALSDILEKYHPQIAFVFTTCASEVIGDNVEGVLRSLDAPGCILRAVRCSGFIGDWQKGVTLAAQTISELIAVLPRPSNSPRVCILDSSFLPDPDIGNIPRMLAERGVSARYIHCGNIGLSDLQSAFCSDINVVSDDGFMSALAHIAKSIRGIRLVGSASFFRQALSPEQFADCIAQDSPIVPGRLHPELAKYISQLSGTKAAVIAFHEADKILKPLLSVCGIEYLCPDQTADILGFQPINDISENTLRRIRELNCRFIFSSFPELSVYFPDAVKVRLNGRFLFEKGILDFAYRLTVCLEDNNGEAFFYTDFL